MAQPNLATLFGSQEPQAPGLEDSLAGIMAPDEADVDPEELDPDEAEPDEDEDDAEGLDDGFALDVGEAFPDLSDSQLLALQRAIDMRIAAGGL